MSLQIDVHLVQQVNFILSFLWALFSLTANYVTLCHQFGNVDATVITEHKWHYGLHNFTSHRWRDNHYVHEGGRILPYTRCNANQFHPGPSKKFVSFKHLGRSYFMMITAASVWGKSEVYTGQPLEVHEIELLGYISGLSSNCSRCCEGKEHCVTTVFPEERYPTIRCVLQDPFDGKEIEFDGSIVYPQNLGGPPEIGNSRPTIGVVCNIRSNRNLTVHSARDLLLDHFEVKVIVNDDILKSSVNVDMCYQHVLVPDDIVVCTQPAFGAQDLSNAFWYGEPPYEGHRSILDSFLVYHSELMGARVVFNDLSNNSAALMDHYKHSQKIIYRGQWNMADFPAELSSYHDEFQTSYDFESKAETTCVFENRIFAKWFIIAHAVDNFVLPLSYNVTVSEFANRLDANKIVYASVPIVLPGSREPRKDYGNVLLRWPEIDPMKYHTVGRYTPLGNPRATAFTWIHWIAILPAHWDISKYKTASQSVYELNICTVHIMGLGRNNLNRHYGGKSDPWYAELAYRLEEKLKNHNFSANAHLGT
jgi:hypothetical protein